MKRLLSLLILGCSWAIAGATLYLNEPFDYPDGPLISVSGGLWITHSGTTGQVDVVSGAVFLTQSESEDVSIAITNVPGGAIGSGMLYAGFTVRFTALPSGSGTYFWHFRDTGTSNFRARVFATVSGAAPGKFRFGIANSTNPPVVIPTDCDLETEYKLVVRYDVANAQTTLWLNPASEESTVNRAEDTFSASVFPITFVCLRQSLSSGNGMGSLYLDNLQVGTSFADVHTPGGPPTISGIPHQYLAAGTSTGPLPFEVDDVETAPELLVVTAVSDNEFLVPNDPQHLLLGGAGKQRTLTVTPVPGREGQATIRVTVRDAQGETATMSFNVYVGMPSITAPPNQVAPTNTTVGPLTFEVRDTESNPLTVTAASSNEILVPPANLVVSGTGTQRTIRITPTPNVSGTATITLTVYDGTWSISTNFLVTFHPKFGLVLGDTFDYPDGPLVETSGGFWTTHSGTTGQVQVMQGHVELSRSLTEDVSAGFTNFLQALGSGIVLYTSMKVTFTELPASGGDYFAHFRDVGTVNYRARLYATTGGVAPGRFRLGIANGSVPANAVLPMDLDLNVPYLVILRYNVDTAETTLWVNPADPASLSVTARDSVTPVSLYYFSFRQSSGIGTLTVDDLKVGTAWEDVWEPVAPQPERLRYQWDGRTLTLVWDQPGLRLQEAPSLEGPWSDIVGASSPHTVPTTSGQRFYRLTY
ncbi:hypothetical protein G4L39_03405 [Limisphaera ngatamarikiensis]|uniref:Uncharacterized protein n=1 Tax=Limisphaera ngatamarikiensis TaxID=1324935 RepID=A0A6M1RP34_9BACT|nr:hypothetical protein [Limisphaera ngatamarikiensis]NGO38445.1 hypothetical protein [Limisphaera ngatamarikiensis]